MFASSLFNGLLSKSGLPALPTKDSGSGIKRHHFIQAVKSPNEKSVDTKKEDSALVLARGRRRDGCRVN